MTRTTRTRRTPAEKSARVTALAEQLAAWRDSTDPALQAAYELRFNHYSARNALLIAMQRPDATVVRGFEDWKREGRHVRRGATGIQILAPAGARKDEPTVTSADGAEGGTVHRFFRVAFVFAFEDTEPNDIEETVAA